MVSFKPSASDLPKGQCLYCLYHLIIASIPILISLPCFANELDDIRKAAISGDAKAQYQYALWKGYVWNEKQDLSEYLDWLAQASKNGSGQATALLTLENILSSDSDSARENLNRISRDLDAIVDNNYNIHISVNGIKMLVNFILSNPHITLTDFGPTHKGGSFIFEKGDTIYACAANKNRAGLLKLNKEGNRICFDDIPLGYDYIIPFYGEHMSLDDAVKNAECYIHFIAGPYRYSIPLTEDEIRMLDINGNEVYRSLWGSDCERVEIPENFTYDSENGPVIPGCKQE